MFKTPYGDHERHYTETGRETADIFKHEITKNGLKELVKTGETNVYEKIQESLEETKIENIIARVVNGDTSMLRANGQFIDCTDIPNNLIEARQAMQRLENAWQQLPKEIKANYNWNIEEYIAKAGTEGWMIDMGLIKVPTEVAKENLSKLKEEITEEIKPTKSKKSTKESEVTA